MRILLIKPKWYDWGLFAHSDLSRVPPLNLGIIAALSHGHEVKILDEDKEPVRYDSAWDLVGITVANCMAPAAFKIADRFRKLSCQVILGGIHPTLMPEESLSHADSVVIGEVESVWPQVLQDCQNNELQPRYQGKQPVDLDTVPFPRRDLFHPGYLTMPIQATRGCDWQCAFCYLSDVSWGRHRSRAVESVCDELTQIKSPYIFFVDDNLFLNPGYASRLLEKMIPLRKHWWVQAPLSFALNKELVKLASRAGCGAVTIGLETFDQTSLDEYHIRHQKIEQYQAAIENLHQNHIWAGAYLMFGFEGDESSTFTRAIEMIKRLGLDDAILYILTPYPGTSLHREMAAQDRILHRNWSDYNWFNVVFKPKNLAPQELQRGSDWAYRALDRYFQSDGYVYKRFFSRRCWHQALRSPSFLWRILKYGLARRKYLKRVIGSSSNNMN